MDAARKLEDAPPENVLRWAVEFFGQGISLASGFGLQSVVQIHMLHELALLDAVEVFYLNTGLLFEETLETCRRLESRYHFRAVPVHPAYSLDEQAVEYGDRLWETDPAACCRIRKVEPLRKYLKSRKAWITGLRRTQSAIRQRVPVVMWDEAHQLVKINPMASTDETELLAYIQQHGVPYNPLFDRGYRSIGCTHCTRAVRQGEHERAGRWSDRGKLECGIHVDGNVIRRDS